MPFVDSVHNVNYDISPFQFLQVLVKGHPSAKDITPSVHVLLKCRPPTVMNSGYTIPGGPPRDRLRDPRGEPLETPTIASRLKPPGLLLGFHDSTLSS